MHRDASAWKSSGVIDVARNKKSHGNNPVPSATPTANLTSEALTALQHKLSWLQVTLQWTAACVCVCVCCGMRFSPRLKRIDFPQLRIIQPQCVQAVRQFRHTLERFEFAESMKLLSVQVGMTLLRQLNCPLACGSTRILLQTTSHQLRMAAIVHSHTNTSQI